MNTEPSGRLALRPRPRQCLLGVALVLGVAAPEAAAATTFNGRADIGPTIAGDAVFWGQNYTDGSGALKQDGRVIARIAAPTPAEGLEYRTMTSVEASPTRIAYAVAEVELVDDAAQTQTEDSTTTPFVSTGGGSPFTNPLGACQAERIATAVEGDTVAFALDRAKAPCESGIYVNGRKIGGGDYVAQVRLAGTYVAWRDAGPSVGNVAGTITVADVNTGATLATFRAKRQPWSAFDIDAQGNIVAEQSGRLLAFTVGNAKARVLSRGASSYVETAGGRIAYISIAKDTVRSLNLIDFKGKVLKRLDRYGPRHWPAGGIALTDHRIAWSVRRGNRFTAPGSVFTEVL